MRIASFFPGKQLFCGIGCSYQGIDALQYIVCHCLGTGSSNNAYVKDATVSTNAFEFAGDVYKCNYNLTMNLHQNFGFWTFVVIHLLLLAASIIMLLIGYIKLMVTNNLNSIKENNLRSGQDKAVGDVNHINIPDKERQDSGNNYTKYDFEEMSIAYEILQKDSRTFFGFFCDTIRRHNYLFAPFLSHSLIKPYWVRTYELMAWLTFAGFFNAFFYWDKYVYARMANNVQWSAMAQVFSKELDKCFFSVLATYPFMLILGYSLRPSRSKLTGFNESLNSGNTDTILKEYQNLNNSMRVQRGIIWLIYSTIIAFFTYYIVLYNAFYLPNTLYWFIGFMISAIAMLLVFQPIISLFYTLVWWLAKKSRIMVCFFAVFRFFMAY